MDWILGLGGYSHDASAALLCDGELVAAIQEERLTRIKHQGGFPVESIKYCLKTANIELADVTAMAFYTKRSNWDKILLDTLGASLKNIKYTFSNAKGFINSIGYRIHKSLNFRADFARFIYEISFDKKKFFDYDHHACHAAAGFYSSPFDEAIVLCVDSVGDGKTTSFWHGKGNQLKQILPPIRFPHSIAHVYNRVTKYLGFFSAGDEYKVMGLSAYGKPVYLDKLRKLVILEEYAYRLNMEYFTYQYEYSLSNKFYEEFGPARKKGEEINKHFADMAASVQALFEEVLFHLVRMLKKKTGIKNLVIGGGAALNCKANGKLWLTGEFDKFFVPSGASDLGTSVGAAQYHWHQIMERPRKFVMRTDNWGPEYDDTAILKEIERSGMKYKTLDNPAKIAAEMITQGKIIGWFQGRLEFGPRALGYRSILADPRNNDVKDRINKKIKFREEFRPFAPSVLRECMKDYFSADVDSPFMTFTFDVLPSQREKIKGIVHVDGSGRVQTVTKEDQPLYYSVINNFYQLTDVPVVLNTSFNLAGEPVVCSPYDAIRTFFTCGMDALIMGKYLVEKV